MLASPLEAVPQFILQPSASLPTPPRARSLFGSPNWDRARASILRESQDLPRQGAEQGFDGGRWN
jgi:hypothetical protein